MTGAGGRGGGGWGVVKGRGVGVVGEGEAAVCMETMLGYAWVRLFRCA